MQAADAARDKVQMEELRLGAPACGFLHKRKRPLRGAFCFDSGRQRYCGGVVFEPVPLPVELPAPVPVVDPELPAPLLSDPVPVLPPVVPALLPLMDPE